MVPVEAEQSCWLKYSTLEDIWSKPVLPAFHKMLELDKHISNDIWLTY